MNSYTCPKCHYADMIQKVSALVDEQTHEIYGSSLAQKLARPSKPELPQKPNHGFTKVLMVAGAVFGLFVSFPCWAFVLFFLMSMILAPFLAQPPFDTWNMPARILTSVAGIVISVVALVVAIFLITLVFRNMGASSKMVAEEYESEITRVNSEIVKWEHAVGRWNELYYCRRDDIVFIPGENSWASTEQMIPYIKG